MKRILFLFLIIQFSCQSQQDCLDGLNLLPMYGEVQKCKKQIELDAEFIKASEKQFKNRKKASDFYVSKGWEYFYSDESDLSMKRFNQAWLLDNKNPEVYGGFGNLLGKRGDFEKSIPYFLKSIEIEPKNAKVYESLSTSYGQIFYKTKDIKYLNLAVESLKKVVKLEPKNGRAYGQLATSFSYFVQKDSLRKYIKITDEINPKFVNPEVREIAKEK